MATLGDGPPEVRPLKSLHEVLDWAPGDDKLVLPTVPLKPRTIRLKDVPKTLVCHDMNFGYLEDRFVQGVGTHEPYRFFHWSHIDFFVYFSHQLVTIPPAGWVDAGHLHGVSVLGTLITEWDDGLETCAELLATEDVYNRFADVLAAVAVHYGFDGWLINIENKIQVDKVKDLVSFVNLLTEKMHAAVPHSTVIWYDSVVGDGELRWQNELNDENKMFFDVCDGIFLNYTWKEINMSNSATHAEGRAVDVFAGVDVFGRNTFGGGGFNTVQAITEARKNGLSVAIFAPGWVYEKFGKEEFTNNEYKFWSLVTDLLPSHGPSFLPFSTSFCQGYGRRCYDYGKVVDPSSWHNLSMQQHQPTNYSSYHKDSVPHRMKVCIDEAYHGGGCLLLEGERSQHLTPTFQVLNCAFPLTETTLITYTWKPRQPNNVDLCMLIASRLADGRQYLCHCMGCPKLEAGAEVGHCIDRYGSYSISAESNAIDKKPVTDWKYPIKHLDELAGKSKPFLTHIEEGWIKRTYVIRVPPESQGQTVEHIAMEVLLDSKDDKTSFEVLVGQIQVIPLSALTLSDSRLELDCQHIETEQDGNTMVVTCLLQWTGGHKHLVSHYSLYCSLKWNGKEKTVYIARTKKMHYKVCGLSLPSPHPSAHSLRFMVLEHKLLSPLPSLEDAASATIDSL